MEKPYSGGLSGKLCPLLLLSLSMMLLFGIFQVSYSGGRIKEHNNVAGLLFSIPGRTEAFWKELDYVKNLWKNRKELKVEDAGIAALFGLECFAWFCGGEIVGRGFTFTGYYV